MAQSSIGGFAIGISPIGGGGGGNGLSSTTRSWRQIVLDSDPDWQRLSLRPWVYEFSNSRRFYDQANPYGIPAIPPDAVTFDGEVVTFDGEPVTFAE